MRSLRSILFFLLGMILGACASQPLPPRALGPDRVQGAAVLATKTVALFVDGRICTGVWVSERSILTANHCVADREDADTPILFAMHDDIYPPVGSSVHEPRVALVSAQDEAHDLALLITLESPRHGIAALRVEPLEQGMFAQSMGHPHGLWFSYSTGDIAAIREKDLGDGSRVWVQCTAPTSRGNSGGGLFDAEARLVGIAHAIVNDGQGLNLFVPVQYVSAFLAAQRAY